MNEYNKGVKDTELRISHELIKKGLSLKDINEVTKVPLDALIKEESLIKGNVAHLYS